MNNVGLFSHYQENQRPPVYNAEDYIISLKKYSRRTSGTNNTKSIYDTTDTTTNTDIVKVTTAPENRTTSLSNKQSDYK